MIQRPVFVYFMISDEPPKVKIGVSFSPEGRLKDLQVGSPSRLALYGKISFDSEDSAYRREKELHELFGHHHSHLEWFEFNTPTKAMIDAILGGCPKWGARMSKRFLGKIKN